MAGDIVDRGAERDDWDCLFNNTRGVIQTSGDRLVYRAYDIDGKLRDELVITK